MDLVFLVCELGKGFVSVFFTWFRNNSIRHGCTAVMLNGVPLPTTVFEKVVKCWGYTLVLSDGDVKWRSREQDWGRIHTPASLSSEHSSKREGLK